jgi:hypothetical protein
VNVSTVRIGAGSGQTGLAKRARATLIGGLDGGATGHRTAATTGRGGDTPRTIAATEPALLGSPVVSPGAV